MQRHWASSHQLIIDTDLLSASLGPDYPAVASTDQAGQNTDYFHPRQPQLHAIPHASPLWTPVIFNELP